MHEKSPAEAGLLSEMAWAGNPPRILFLQNAKTCRENKPAGGI
jgi:hypothetical protein